MTAEGLRRARRLGVRLETRHPGGEAAPGPRYAELPAKLGSRRAARPQPAARAETASSVPAWGECKICDIANKQGSPCLYIYQGAGIYPHITVLSAPASLRCLHQNPAPGQERCCVTGTRPRRRGWRGTPRSPISQPCLSPNSRQARPPCPCNRIYFKFNPQH